MMSLRLLLVLLLNAVPLTESATTLASLQESVDQLTAAYTQLSAKYAADYLQLKSKIDNLTQAANIHVAFLAQLAPDVDNVVPGPSSGPFVFGKVILNDGNAYRPQSGIFVTPFDGVYQFGLQIFLKGAQYTVAEIMVNNLPVSRMGIDTSGQGTMSPDDSDSTSVIVKLRAGDEVWVESANGGHYFVSDFHTYFTGSLLYTL